MADKHCCPCCGEAMCSGASIMEELGEQCLINAKGGDRELKLITENARLRIELEAARKENAGLRAAGCSQCENRELVFENKKMGLRKENKKLREALEFYANRKHIEVLMPGTNFDMNRMDWRVAHPYIGAVEYGQTAKAALAKKEGESKWISLRK